MEKQNTALSKNMQSRTASAYGQLLPFTCSWNWTKCGNKLISYILCCPWFLQHYSLWQFKIYACMTHWLRAYSIHNNACTADVPYFHHNKEYMYAQINHWSFFPDFFNFYITFPSFNDSVISSTYAWSYMYENHPFLYTSLFRQESTIKKKKFCGACWEHPPSFEKSQTVKSFFTER